MMENSSNKPSIFKLKESVDLDELLDRSLSRTKTPEPKSTVNNHVPLFCVETRDRISGRKLFVNFLGVKDVPYPDNDINDDLLVRELMQPSQVLDAFGIPMNLSQLFWKKITEGKSPPADYYVLDCNINKKFAIRRVVNSDVIRHYVISVTFSEIEKKFLDINHKKCGQFVGHNLDLDICDYKVLEGVVNVDRSTEPVNNRVIPLNDQLKKRIETSPSPEVSSDLFYRPKSKILTCSITTEVIPSSLGFNDDRIIIKAGDKILLDVFLPFFIDLSEPVKYRYDDRSCLFRVVFRIIGCL